jgi:hypothetical protein
MKTFALILLGPLAWLSAPVWAATVAPQVGSVPIVLNPDPVPMQDNVQVLLASLSEHFSTMTENNSDDGRKNFWLENTGTPQTGSDADYVAWSVSAPATAAYQVVALLNAPGGQQFALQVNDGPGTTLTLDAKGGWDKYLVGNVTLKAGSNRISLTRTGTLSGQFQIKSLELLRASDVAAYNARVSSVRRDTSWLAQSKYGLFLQYGVWGAPNNVAGRNKHAKSLDQQAADFDVPSFVKQVKQTGAAYVIWSISWWGYRMDAPLTSVNAIVQVAGGSINPSFATTSRDLIGEVATALQAEGIRFVLYYHLGSEEPIWWAAQKFPTSTFSLTGTGDRSTFLKNWQTVVKEIGERYGTKLDGIIFDDGVSYYPAPFELMEQIARTGDPHRLVSWNSWIMPRLTDFQDVWFGEGSIGTPFKGSNVVGGNGIFPSGPQTGLLEQGMFPIDIDWGITIPGNQLQISTKSSYNSYFAHTTVPTDSNGLTQLVANASARNAPLSINYMMYEDGSVAEADLARLNDVRQAIRGTIDPLPQDWFGPVNDTAPSIVYKGNWSRGSGIGDYHGDHHSTRTIGDSVNYTFNGTGLDVLGPKSGTGNTFTVTLDNTLIGTFRADANASTPQAVIYGARHIAPGSHTIQLTLATGTLPIDAMVVETNPVMLNDNVLASAKNPAGSFRYDSGWTYSGNRSAGDYKNDVHYTQANGGVATITFNGTGFDLFGPMSDEGGLGIVVLDGKQISTVNARFADGSAYNAQQYYLGIRNQAPGPHTLTVTKTGGNYLQVDAINVIDPPPPRAAR